jgi:folate-dependent phosphoribosylglycinamide formyltransferase PurN
MKELLKIKKKKTGWTVHFVNEKLDSGKLIVQKIFFIDKYDKINILKKKTQKLEHKAFSEAIIKMYRYC